MGKNLLRTYYGVREEETRIGGQEHEASHRHQRSYPSVGGDAHSGPAMNNCDQGRVWAMPRVAMRVLAVYVVKWRKIEWRLHSSRFSPSVSREANRRPAMHESESAKQEYSGSSDRVRNKATTRVRVC